MNHSCLRPHQKIIGTAFSIRLRRLASFYSEDFSSGTLCNYLQPMEMGNRSKSPVSTIPPLRREYYLTTDTAPMSRELRRFPLSFCTIYMLREG